MSPGLYPFEELFVDFLFKALMRLLVEDCLPVKQAVIVFPCVYSELLLVELICDLLHRIVLVCVNDTVIGVEKRSAAVFTLRSITEGDLPPMTLSIGRILELKRSWHPSP